uniref:RNA-directed DNA polymerase n=1 Tax=Anopheles atroparvus TaxID=41427 RepID=A0AAG5DCG3_ANOAO
MSGKKIKLLIDTGANKNILRPGLIKATRGTSSSLIRNINGEFKVNKIGQANLLGHNLPMQTYYELDFHNFFDGILGAEYMSQTATQIDFEKETISIVRKTFPFRKYYPSVKLYNHVVTIDTTNDGEWFVPSHQKLCSGIFVEPGLYKSSNGKSTIKVICTSPEKPLKLGLFGLSVNNFEAITPIPVDLHNSLHINDIKQIIRTKHLSNYEIGELLPVIHSNQGVLLRNNEKLTASNIIKHKIITKDEEPTYTKSYRYPHNLKKDVEEQIKELLENGIISPSNSPYSSPIWVVPKKQDASGKKKIRVVIDYRKLNDKTVNDKFPMPQIEDILDNLGKSSYFTTLDLKSGFHQIEMDPLYREKTAFSTPNGHYEFNRMPFGLKNAPATFQRAMNSVLSDLIGRVCFVYLDDIIVIGKDLNSHLKNLSVVLQRLACFNLKIQLDKCEFLRRETEFLGHTITPEGIKPNPDKIRKILEWSLPKTKKEIKQFLGLAGYYRKFIKDYSKITRPLSSCLKKEAKLDVAKEEYLKSFENLKAILSSDQVLAFPDFEEPFILTTDASNHALGAVLSQIQSGQEKPIAFGSRTLNETEQRYSTTEKEALAIIWAVEKYKPYLYGRKFTLVTDHKPLVFIKSCSKNAKILRWRLELENYEFEIKYKEGKANVVADALSRKPMDEILVNVNTRQSIYPNPSTSRKSGSTSRTIHSAKISGDYYIHHTERPINYFKNQIVFQYGEANSETQETPFPLFKRTVITRQEFQEHDIHEILLRIHNGKQTAIHAPIELLSLIQQVYRKNFD